jgi:hypothetical protein
MVKPEFPTISPEVAVTDPSIPATPPVSGLPAKRGSSHDHE